MELAYRFASGEVLAITGTNGKTTTTALLGEIMKAYRDSVFVVGNIGTPYTGAALEMKEDSVTVAEMSSFQLETIDTFHPKVSAILNITPDHLNRHHTMEAYIQAKEEITKNQTEEDVCVLNYEDEVLRAFGEKLHTQVLYFSSRRKLERGIYLEDGKIIYADGKPEVLCKVEELKLLGTHNYENVMAASAMAAAYGVPLSSIRETIRNFGGVAHRIEFVTEKEGVAYYNDSKGTNPDAAIKAVEAMNRPTILIGGGYDKNSSYDEWIDSFGEKVRYLVLVGATKEKIAETARRKGFDKKEAVMNAHKACALSIMTSGFSFFAATFGVAWYSKVDMIGAICTLLSRGALISMACVIFILPAMFIIFDKLICKTSIDFLGEKAKAKAAARA